MAKIQPLCADLQKIANEELGEVAFRIEEDLEALKIWIQQQPHLRARTDDQFLIQFLRGCKYSLERAKEKVDKFYALTSKYPELLAARDVDKPVFRQVHNMGYFLPLPVPLNDNGPRIVFFRMNFSPSQHTIEEILQPCNTMHELMLLNDPYACINGLVYIADFDNASANHYLHFTPSVIKRLVTFYEKAMPYRIKAWVFINVSTLAEQFFKIVLPCVSDKLRKRIYIYNKKGTKLVEQIPLKYLPKEYGGENSSLKQISQDYNKVWDEYRDYLKENAQYGTDEYLRPGNPLDFDGLFGMCGSFRKINVD